MQIERYEDCPQCGGQGCWFCARESIAHTRQEVERAERERLRKEALDFCRAYFGKLGVPQEQIAPEQGEIDLIIAAMEAGRQSVRLQAPPVAVETEESLRKRFELLDFTEGVRLRSAAERDAPPWAGKEPPGERETWIES